MKLGTVVVSIAAFVGSLGAVSYLHPGIKVTAQPVASTVSFNAPATGRTTRQQASVAPLVRTRGS